jgi:hypothetical protein
MNSSEPTVLDRLQAGQLDRAEFRAIVLEEVYAGLHAYCRIPEGYSHCDLATRQVDLESLDDEGFRALLDSSPSEIINPQPSQVRAVELFRMLFSGDPLVCEDAQPMMPTVGAYLYGPPGCGKTHLMAAYGRKIQALLDEKLSDIHLMLDHYIDEAFLKFSARVATEREAMDEDISYLRVDGEDIVRDESPHEEFWGTVSKLKKAIAEYEYQPTDVVYIGFQELFELCKYSSQRAFAMDALEKARVVFIDDIHPQGDPEQVQLVLHLLERRYELNRGGTFLTTNLTTTELGGGDAMLGGRLMSRCAEMLVTIDFSDCEDWRQTVKSRKIKMIDDELTRRAADHQASPSEIN